MIREFNRRSFSVRVRLRQIEEKMALLYSIQAEMMVKIDEDDFVLPAYSGGIPDAIQGGIAPYLKDCGLPVGGEYQTVSWYYVTRGKVEIAIPLDIVSITGELLAYSLNGLEDMLASLDREDDKHETYDELTAAALRQEGALKGSGLSK